VIPQMLENTWCEIKYCLDILWATNGTQIEMCWTWWAVLSNRTNQFSVSHIPCFVCTWNVVNKFWPPCITQWH
jgi:hypothetical protein